MLKLYFYNGLLVVVHHNWAWQESLCVQHHGLPCDCMLMIRKFRARRTRGCTTAGREGWKSFTLGKQPLDSATRGCGGGRTAGRQEVLP